MSAILFGSISTIADTSELQRQAFNQAFEAHGLEWRWDGEEYRSLLEQSGGQSRIAHYARSAGQTVDTEAIHQSKSENFQRSLAESRLSPRPGVVESLHEAKDKAFKVAFVTTTSPKRCAAISGMSSQEAEATIAFLFEHATREENIYRHAWSPGDVVMWDNGCVLHRGDHARVIGDRVMHRGMVAA